VAVVAQILSPLSPEKAAEGETLRHMSRPTTTHAYHLPVTIPHTRAPGVQGAALAPLQNAFCNSPFVFYWKKNGYLHQIDLRNGTLHIIFSKELYIFT
jgi:hypothetical protein